jgi:hypothetical protein
MNPKQAVRIMNIVRIFAVVMIIASAILYFTAKQYAIYPAIAGFAMIAFINLPLNIWLAFKNERAKKQQMEEYKAGRKNNDEQKSDEPIRYKNRKSGLRWGGGNVHASNAERGSRKKFLGR